MWSLRTIIAYQTHDGIDVDAASHMANEVYPCANAHEGQNNAEGQRKVRNNAPRSRP
jgi:hypothetical protein